jgi:hypothetical protein
MQQSMICSKCGSPNNEGSQYCLSCGMPLGSNCPNCSEIVDPANKFCPACGVGLGWAGKIRDIQNKISQTESVVTNVMGRSSSQIEGQLSRMEQSINNNMAQYANDLHGQQSLLHNTAVQIKELIEMEHKMASARRLHNIGMGLIGIGLGIIGLSYVLNSLDILAIAGIGVIAVGFLMLLISSFMGH